MITIRAARPNDVDALVRFQQKMAKETESLELNADVLREGVSALLADSTKGRYDVAEEGGTVVGSLMTTFEWSDWRNGTVLWIQSVFVLPEHRGKGIYKQMYMFIRSLVEEDANLKGIRLYVDKTNVSAQKVYSRLGMNGEHYQVFEWMK